MEVNNEPWKLKGRIWFEYGQYNAQIPVFFLVGIGKNEFEAIDNLFISLKEHVCDSFVHQLTKVKVTEFEIEISDYGIFLVENFKIQALAYKYKGNIVKESLSKDEYIKALTNFVPNIEDLAALSCTN